MRTRSLVMRRSLILMGRRRGSRVGALGSPAVPQPRGTDSVRAVCGRDDRASPLPGIRGPSAVRGRGRPVHEVRRGRAAHYLGGNDCPVDGLAMPRCRLLRPVGEAVRAYLPRHYHPVPSNMLEGAHVLVIDDTWVSGASAESTATSLKWEGASRVTALTSVMWW